MKYGRMAAVVSMALIAGSASANHHFMQIQIVVGGVGGDTTAQAIQLRQRFAGQNVLSAGKLVAFDAAGLNPITIIDFTTNVPNSLAGDTILVCTNSFLGKTMPTTVADFIMTPIPASYLAAGKLSFQANAGTTWWTFGWGGASYTGNLTLDLTNDSNGNAAPAFGVGLPIASNTAIQFNGAASAASTTNLADYSMTSGAAVLKNNARNTFTIKTPCPADINGDGFVDDGDFVLFASAYDQLICGSPCPADFNNDAFVDDSDFVFFAEAYNALLCP